MRKVLFTNVNSSCVTSLAYLKVKVEWYFLQNSYTDVYYHTVLVYTITTIHLSVGG